jgi:hypothetical protein
MREPTFVAIDPGTEQSAYIVFSCLEEIDEFGTLPNITLERMLRDRCYRGRSMPGLTFDHLAIEMVASYGKPVGEEVFQTVLWIGRFLAAYNGPHTLIKRTAVKMHLCHSLTKVTDGVIRQRLIDLYGGKEKAIGKKAAPGPLYGFKADQWQALAVAWTWYEQREAIATLTKE